MKRYIQLLSILLSIVLVFSGALVCTAEDDLVNIAVNKPAKASDWEPSHLPEYACDGINDNEQYTSWKSAGENASPWLILDLNLSYRLYSLIIEAKKGETAESERSNFKVYGAQSEDFSDSELILDMTNRSIPKNGEISQIIKTSSLFRYIKIEKSTYEPLSVGEIKVMAKKENLASAVGQNSATSRQPYFSEDRNYFTYEDAPEFEDNGETALLKALGIMQGFEDGSFYPYETVSKAEFTAYVMKMATSLKMTDSPVAPVGYTFVDVPEEHWANAYVEKAYQMGIVSGDGAGSFYPDKRVTYNEAAKMLIVALGYEKLATVYGGYPAGYFKLATELGLHKNMAYYGDEITHIDCAIMIYNAMVSDYIKLDFTLTEEALSLKNLSIHRPGTRFMTEVAGLVEATGVVDGTQNMSLTNSEPALEKDKISVNKTIFCTEMPARKQYVGYSVKYWYQLEQDEVYNTLITVSKLSRNKTVEFIKEDYIRSANGKVSFYNQDEKEISVNYRLDVDVVYNGRAWLNYDPAKLFDQFTSAVLIDNNGDAVYDCIIMVKEQTGVIKFVNLHDEQIYFKNGINALSYGKSTVFSASWDDTTIAPEELKENDVLTIVSSRNDEEGIDSVIVCRDNIYGSVSMVTTDDGIRIKNKIYQISPGYTNADIGIGDSGYFYLDYHGEICFADIKDSYEGDYGYLVGVSQNHNLNGFQIRIFTSAGKMKDYAPYKTLVIDGNTYGEKEYARITACLSASKQKDTYGQPIRYVVKNNTLRLIDTLSAGTGDETDVISKVISNETIYYSSSRIFDARYPVHDDVVIMRVPESTSDYDKYTLETMSKYRNGYPYNFYGYTDNEDLELKLILTYGEYALERDSSLTVVADVFDCIDKENEPKRAIKALVNGEIKTYIEDENGMIAAAGVSAGDIVAFSADAENVLYGIEKRFYQGALPAGASSYAISTESPAQGVSGEAYNFYQDYFMVYATVEKRTGNNILIKVTDPSGNEVTNVKNNARVLFNATDLNIVVYDSSAATVQSRVRKGSINDLIDEQSGTPSKIVLKARNGNISFICVMK